MKSVVLLVFLHSVWSKENEFKEERRVAGGGNYGGFIGLTTYGAGPVFVKGRYERDRYGGFGQNWRGYGPEYDMNQEEGDEQKNAQITDKNEKSDDYLEYLGYRGGRGFCTGNNRDGYGSIDLESYADRLTPRRGNNSNFDDNEMRERCNYLFGYTGPTANDEEENLIRPCALNDWQCIRNFFAANGMCKPAYGPIPDPLYLATYTAFYSSINVTVSTPNLMVRGLSSARIRDFYVNRKSGNLVFTIDVTNLNETIPRAYFRYKRTEKESIVLADYATVVYRAVTFTAVIPNVPNMRLDLADIHPDVQDATPPLFIGPGAYNSTDPDVVTAFAALNTPGILQVIVREILTFQAPLFTSIYIQENICDFGLKLISV